MKIKLFLVPLILFSLMYCATTITTRTINQPIMPDSNLEKKDIIDANSYILMENGFSINTINETFGIVTTDWRKVKSGSDTAANVLSAISAGLASFGGQSASHSISSRVMMIQVKITEEGYQLTPKVNRITQTRSTYGGGYTSNDISYPDQDSKEGKIAIKIVEEINNLLGINNNYYWTESTISVEK